MREKFRAYYKYALNLAGKFISFDVCHRTDELQNGSSIVP